MTDGNIGTERRQLESLNLYPSGVVGPRSEDGRAKGFSTGTGDSCNADDFAGTDLKRDTVQYL